MKGGKDFWNHLPLCHKASERQSPEFSLVWRHLEWGPAWHERADGDAEGIKPVYSKEKTPPLRGDQGQDGSHGPPLDNGSKAVFGEFLWTFIDHINQQGFLEQLSCLNRSTGIKRHYFKLLLSFEVNCGRKKGGKKVRKEKKKKIDFTFGKYLATRIYSPVICLALRIGLCRGKQTNSATPCGILQWHTSLAEDNRHL